jgi:hypothetical protein
VPADDKDRFLRAAEALADKCLLNPNLGSDMAKLHDDHFAWPVIAQRLIAVLREAEEFPNQTRQ